jgi:RNA polymerase sigma factor for flagellar operon FliA
MNGTATVGDIWTEFAATRRSELREQLITSYVPLVRFVVGRLGIPATSLLEADDLVSFGIIGLINAIDRYDPSRGVRFEAFAAIRIRGAVIDQLRTLNWLPRSAMTRVRQIESALAVLEQRLGRPAKEEEAAAELGISTERYRQMLFKVGTTVMSLDAPLGPLLQDESAASLGDLLEDHDVLGPAEEVEQRELIAALSVAIDNLPQREKFLLSLYYHRQLTMKEISKLMGVSESRVCQLHIQAVLRLRSALSAYTRIHR